MATTLYDPTPHNNFISISSCILVFETHLQSFPEAYAYVRDNKYAGNYLNMITKEKVTTTRLQLDNAFSQEWNKADPAKRVPLISLEIRRNSPSQALSEFLRQDHVAFWNFEVATGTDLLPLQAILLTDTGRQRDVANNCVFILRESS